MKGCFDTYELQKRQSKENLLGKINHVLHYLKIVGKFKVPFADGYNTHALLH